MAKRYYCPLKRGGKPPEDDGKKKTEWIPCPQLDGTQVNPNVGVAGTGMEHGILVIGDNPSEFDDEIGRPFTGEVGEEIGRVLDEAKISRALVNFVHCVRCRPSRLLEDKTGDRPPLRINCKPNSKAKKLCWQEHLPAVVEKLRPRVVVACGAFVMDAIFGVKGVMKMNGFEIEHDVEWLPRAVAAVHPSFVLRNPTVNHQTLVDAFKGVKKVFLETCGCVETPTPPPDFDIWVPKGPQEFDALMNRIDEEVATAEACEVPFLGYDVETSGLDPWFRHRPPRVLTLSLSSTPRRATAFPINHPEWSWRPDQYERLVDRAKAVLTAPGTIKTAHNAKFDNKWLRVCHGFRPETPAPPLPELPGEFCTLLAHALTAVGESHKLDDIIFKDDDLRWAFGQYSTSVHEKAAQAGAAARKAYGEKKSKDDELAEKEGRLDFSQVPIQELGTYNGKDTAVTVELARKLYADLQTTGATLQAFTHILMPGSRVLEDMECEGMALDEDALLRVMADYILREQRALYRLESLPKVRVVKKELGIDSSEQLNYRSTQQKAKLLYTSPNGFQLTPQKQTDTGQPSTDKDAMKALLALDELPDDARQAIKFLGEYGQASKILSTYLRKATDMRGSDAMIHGTFNLHVAVTGRLSATRPNLQNQPKHIREIYRSRYEDGLIISADYSQLEARVIACFCQDPGLLEIFREGLDFHVMNAARMFGLDPGRPISGKPETWGQVTADMRQRGKSAVSFGLMYGRQAYALARDLEIPISEAEAMRDAYFNAVPQLQTWVDAIVAYTRSTGYIETATGRRRPLPDIWAADRRLRAEAERQAVNTPVQGTASDVTLSAMIRIRKALLNGGYRARLVVTVHDSIGIDTPREEVRDVAQIVVREMQDTSMYPWAIVPFTADLCIGKSWDHPLVK